MCHKIGHKTACQRYQILLSFWGARSTDPAIVGGFVPIFPARPKGDGTVFTGQIKDVTFEFFA